MTTINNIFRKLNLYNVKEIHDKIVKAIADLRIAEKEIKNGEKNDDINAVNKAKGEELKAQNERIQNINALRQVLLRVFAEKGGFLQIC